METRRWVNPTLPQTLQIAVWLCYFRAVVVFLFGLDFQFVVFPFSDIGPGQITNRMQVTNPVLRFGLPLLLAGGAYLVANERKRGYSLALAGAALPLVARLVLATGISFSSIPVPAMSPFGYDIFGLMFEVALLVLLIHPESRSYGRIWFK